MAELRRTPLNAVHRESGAKMVPFGEWDLPVEYAGLISEHLAVRKAAGHPVRVVGTRGGEWLVRVLDHGLLSVDLVINRVSVCVGEGWL